MALLSQLRLFTVTLFNGKGSCGGKTIQNLDKASDWYAQQSLQALVFLLPLHDTTVSFRKKSTE